MDIRILGPSCARCLKLETLVVETLQVMGIRDATVRKVTIQKDMERFLTGDPPGLVVDDQLVWSGGSVLPSTIQIAEWIREAGKVRAP